MSEEIRCDRGKPRHYSRRGFVISFTADQTTAIRDLQRCLRPVIGGAPSGDYYFPMVSASSPGFAAICRQMRHEIERRATIEVMRDMPSDDALW